MFDHEKLDVYQVSLQFVAWVFERASRLKGLYRHARDELIRALQSIPRNIAEGNGKKSKADRKRFMKSLVVLHWNVLLLLTNCGL